MKKSLPKITLVSSSVFLKWIAEGIREIYDELGKIFEFKIYFLNDVNEGKIPKQDFMEEIYSSDVMLLDIRGNCPAAEILVDTYSKMEQEDLKFFEKKTIISLVGGNSEIRKLTKMGPFQAKKIPSSKLNDYGLDDIPDLTWAVRFGQRMTKLMNVLGKIFPFKALKHARNWALMMDYWVYGLGGIAANHKSMLLFLLKNYLGYKDLKVPKPQKIPSYGIYDVRLNEYFDNLETYLNKINYDPEKQTIGLFFYGGLYFEQSLPIVKKFMEYLDDFNIIPVFSDVLTNVPAHRDFFFKDGIKIVSVIINLQYFQLNGGPFGGDGSITINLYQKLDVPQFNPIIQFDNPIEDYRNSQEGIIPINQIISIVMPELDGRFEMMTVGCMRSLGYSELIKSDVLEVVPLDKNIELMINRIKKWLGLRRKLNSEKKIVLIIYNYPPGEDKIGNAAYLDVSQSVQNLFKKLKKEGYSVGDFPENKSLGDIFIEGGSVNCPKYTSIKNFNGITLGKDKYLEFFRELPDELKNEIIEFWGEPIGDIMVENSNIKLPLIGFGNIYIGLQPTRSKVSGDPNEYHNRNLPPQHQYLAFYRYIERIIDADAVIHIGTHGTEEFLPGKECAGDVDDYNINILGNLPNIYYYHITNTSESAIAKRRANALIINHAGPSFKNTDLYQEIENLELLIEEYHSKVELKISDSENNVKSERLMDLEKDINDLANTLELDFNTISELEDLLYRYKTSIIPMGLHTLGENYSAEEKVDLIQMILLNSGEIPQVLEDLINKFGSDQKEQAKNIHLFLEQFFQLLGNSIKLSKDMIKNLEENFTKKFELSNDDIKNISDWLIDLIYRMDNSSELENIIHALEGGYITPGFGGDSIRSPQIFPTGRNSYGFDPRLIPNSTAYRRGAKIAETLIENYKKENGRYPETVSVILWAFETMKTGGETIGQIFSYLGVKAVKNKSIWTTELEAIPLQEMTHPRINVITTIGGIFRDTFPYLLDLINRAIELVANLNESQDHNFVKKSIKELKSEGVEIPDARIFGPPPGKYNTNLTNIISAGQWGEEIELVNDYLNNMCFAYMKNQKVKKTFNTFTSSINKINLISQIRDSSEYHITDLDHYYEFTGGLARSFEEISGKDANVYIADSSTKEIKVDTLENSIREGTITRTLNPQWIKALLKHKYHGGQKAAERIENMLGLSATTHNVDNWLWDKVYNQYIENEEIRDSLTENNRFAMMDIMKNLLQAEKRDYWKASDEQIDNLKKLYLELENWVEKTY
ncbi:MAG: cobaltochelatase subunit CobN [Promethearchaeota archaeon]